MAYETDDYGEILSIIEEETLYLRHYIGKIVDIEDTLNQGRVKILIRELGFEDESLGIWAYPRQGASMIIPEVGSWAEIYFINGDRSRPVYLYPATEINETGLINYSGDTTKEYIFESPSDETADILYDTGAEVLTFLQGEDNPVKYSKYDINIQSLITQVNSNLTLIATAISSLGGSYTPSALSEDTSGAKSERIAIP